MQPVTLGATPGFYNTLHFARKDSENATTSVTTP